MSGPVGELHPVQGLLERFEAGPGCAARERGNKETHVIAVGRVTNSPENKVMLSVFNTWLSLCMSHNEVSLKCTTQTGCRSAKTNIKL